MVTYANAVPTPETDGIPYGTNVPLTSTEADLGDGLLTPDPIATTFGEAIAAIIKLTVNGIVTGNTTYVVMQMDMGDGTWVDMNWIVWTGNQGSATFVMSNGIAGANTFQQSRNSGQPPTPQSSGQNQLALGGRIRFVGKSQFVGGSSSLAGLTTSVLATIKYRLQAVR